MTHLLHAELAQTMQSLLAQPHHRLNVLFWHWGRGGAGSKFTYELVKATHQADEIRCFVSAVAECELAQLIRSLDADIPLCEITTFKGDKQTFTGKLSALYGLTGLAQIGHQFKDFVAHHQIDLVICTMPAIWDLAAIKVIRAMQVPFILVVHDATPHPGDGYPFRRLSMQKEIDAADGLITLSDHVRQGMLARRTHPADRVWTVPHGAFEFGAKRQRNLMPGQPLRLLFLGRIVAYKGLDLLLDTCRLLQDQNIPITLEVMGSGDIEPYHAGLEALDAVRVINKWVDETEIGEALSRNDVMMLPYWEASQSGVAASAATAGMPVIATPVGGLTEQVIDGTTGLVASDVTPEALAHSIRMLISDPDLYARCSTGAITYAEQELGWGPIAERIASIARDVVTSNLMADYR